MGTEYWTVECGKRKTIVTNTNWKKIFWGAASSRVTGARGGVERAKKTRKEQISCHVREIMSKIEGVLESKNRRRRARSDPVGWLKNHKRNNTMSVTRTFSSDNRYRLTAVAELHSESPRLPVRPDIQIQRGQSEVRARFEWVSKDASSSNPLGV